MPAFERDTQVSGVRRRLTAPARAEVLSPARTEEAARLTATSAEEQAVSEVIDGPVAPKKKERRPEAAESVLPVPKCASSSSRWSAVPTMRA